jgi:septal ring-binding cell division protein DamX
MALGLASCGEGDSAALLPGNTASEISSNLDEVRRLSDEGECVGAQDAALEVSDQIDALGGVDRELKRALREGADRLNEVVAACEEAPEEEVETEPSVSTEPIEVEPPEGEKKSKGEKREPPGQEKKAEKEEEAVEPETTPETPPSPPTETPAEPPAGGGTPSGGVSPSAPAGSE